MAHLRDETMKSAQCRYRTGEQKTDRLHRHGAVTGFPREHVHFLRQSTSGLSLNMIKYQEDISDHFQNLTSFSEIHILPISQMSWKSTRNFFIVLQTNTDEHIVPAKSVAKIIMLNNHYNLVIINLIKRLQMLPFWPNYIFHKVHSAPQRPQDKNEFSVTDKRCDHTMQFIVTRGFCL